MIVSYIELGEHIEILFFLLFLVIFTVLITLNFKFIRQVDFNNKYSRSSKISVWLLRVHVAKYLQVTQNNFDEIKETYLKYLKKNLTFFDADFNQELKQLKFLVENNVDVEKTIKEGNKESHKKRLLILSFLFYISLKEGKINQKELNYLDEVYKELKISFQIYNSIKSKYFIAEKKKYNPSFDKIFLSKRNKAYKILGCTESSSIQEIKEAYRILAKKYHPDTNLSLNKNQKKEYLIKFHQITGAYEYIKRLNN